MPGRTEGKQKWAEEAQEMELHVMEKGTESAISPKKTNKKKTL